MSRMKPTYRCTHCGRAFHPAYGSQRLYCSVECVWAETSRRTQAARAARGPVLPVVMEPEPEEESS